MDIIELLGRRDELQKEKEALEKELSRYEQLPDEKKLAERIHWMFCRKNHIDECSWNYDLNGREWEKFTHIHFLELAREMLATGVQLNDIIEILKVAKKA